MLVFKPCENFLLLPPPKFFTTTSNSKPHFHYHHHLHHHHDVKLLHFSPLKAHFKSTLSSSSPLSSSSEEDSSFLRTVGFLKDSGGLSYEQAIQVFRKQPNLLQDGGRKPRSVIAYLESIGLSKTHISKAIYKFPRILFSDVEKTLKPRIQIFQDFGFPESGIADLIASRPLNLIRGVSIHIKPSLDFIRSFVKTDEDLIKIFKHSGFFLLGSGNFRKYVEPNIDLLRRQHGVPDSEIVYLISTHLSALVSTPERFKSIVERIVNLGFKPETRKFANAVAVMYGMKKPTWDSKIELLKGLGWSDEQILDAFRRLPRFLSYSEKKTKEGIGFFKESLNWDASVLSHHPMILNYSLKRRVIPRYAVLKCLMSNQIIKEDTLFIYMLTLGETLFLSRYVFKYQEQLPYLYEVYKKECMMGCEEEEEEEDNGEITKSTRP